MNYFDFKGQKLSKIILGGDYYGTVVPETSVYMLLDYFFDIGGNFFDTARMYTNGLSETIYGRWFKNKNRDKLFLATKGGFPDNGVSRIYENDVRYDLENSLKALNMEYIDLYYLHRDDEKIPCEEIIGYLNKFRDEGKIKNIGVSNWKAERIEKANSYAEKHGLEKITFSQIKYSMVKTSPGYKDDPTLVEMNESEYEIYKKLGIKVAAFASQGKGFFSKYQNGGADRLDQKTRERYFCNENINGFEKAKHIAEKYNISVASVCLLYLIEQPFFDVMPIIGCKTLGQLKNTLLGTDTVLTEKDREYLVK